MDERKKRELRQKLERIIERGDVTQINAIDIVLSELILLGESPETIQPAPLKQSLDLG